MAGPYMIFCQEQRANIVEADPSLAFGQVGKALGAAWQKLSQAEKATYKRQVDTSDGYSSGEASIEDMCTGRMAKRAAPAFGEERSDGNGGRATRGDKIPIDEAEAARGNAEGVEPIDASLDHESLVRRLEAHMASKVLSQASVASAMSVSGGALSRWRGRCAPQLTITTMQQLDVKVAAYLDRENAMSMFIDDAPHNNSGQLCSDTSDHVPSHVLSDESY